MVDFIEYATKDPGERGIWCRTREPGPEDGKQRPESARPSGSWRLSAQADRAEGAFDIADVRGVKRSSAVWGVSQSSLWRRTHAFFLGQPQAMEAARDASLDSFKCIDAG